jgi:hypothetical protein|tara:strand:+ start:7855 stop:8499 length:645 start_codon:yes stop_codon:yes gene_type:complete
MKQLLVDTIVFNVTPTMLKESAEKHGRFLVSGVLQRADAKNQNGRVYPRNILEREVKKYIGREIKENRAYGELDHPESAIVELKNTSHIVRSVEWKGDDVIGTVEILNTPAGTILQEIIKAGCTVGISSRGMGSVKQIGEETVAVESDFDLICWDFVSNPSTQGAFLSPKNEGIIKEGVTKKSNTYKYKKANTLMRDIMCEVGGYCECDFGVKL